MNTKLTGSLGLMVLTASLHAQSLTTIVSSGLNEPNGVACAFDTNGAYYITDAGQGNQIVKYSKSGGFVSLAGNSSYWGYEDGVGSGALFNQPWGIVYVPARGGFVVSDYGNQLIRLVTTNGVVTTLAGTVDPNGALADGQGTNAQFSFPCGVAADSKGNVYIADFGNGAVRVLGMDNSARTIFANFAGPQGIAVSAETNIWVADTMANVIKLITLDTNSGTYKAPVRIAGNGFNYSVSNPDNTIALNAFFNQPRGLVWVGGKTGLVVADTGNNLVRSVFFNPVVNGYSVTTITNGFNAPIGLGYDNEGTILVADSKNVAVRGIVRASQPAPTISPDSGSYSNDVTVAFATTLDPSALPVFHYTTDGSAPTLVSAAGSSVTLSRDAAVQARCFSPDYATSSSVSNNYSFHVATPVIDPPGANSDNPVQVTLSSDTTNATLYWTINGKEPTTNSAKYTSPFSLGTNGVLMVKGFRDGYAASATVSNTFNLVAADPVISPNGGVSNNTFSVTVASSTTNAVIRYTTDGIDPTPNSPVFPGSLLITKGLNLTVKAFLDGFVPSQKQSAQFGLTVATPVISASANSSDNPIRVTLTDDTAAVAMYWTADGNDPTTNSTPYTGPFDLLTNGTFKVLGVRSGFANSIVASTNFNLAVGKLTVSPASTGINSNLVTISTTTTNAIFYYTLDGSDPVANNPGTLSVAGPLATLLVTTNTTLALTASYAGFAPASAAATSYQVQVDKPVMNPSGGYFPNGGTVTLTVQRPDATLYYTVDGSDPTAASLVYDTNTGIRIDQVHFPLSDLHVIKARAFAPNTVPSVVISGQSLQTNSVGVPRDMVAGAGSTIVVPVVANLSSNQQLRSLIFRLEIFPGATNPAPAIVTPMEALSISTNDFVPVVVNSDGSAASITTETYQNGTTNGMQFNTSNTNLMIQNFGVIANVKVKIPSTGANGMTYTMKVLEVSGTSNGGQNNVTVQPLPDRTVTVGSVRYLAGSSTPGAWYNAGDFGDPGCTNLNDADVNAAFEASLGIHTPYVFSDAFNAMDVYPETRTLIGDGMITYLDWQHILKRALRLETNTWVRVWSNGALTHTQVAPLTPTGHGSFMPLGSSPASCDIWLRHALIGAETLTNLVPGQYYSMPVYAKVLPGFQVNGMQFRASLVGEGDAPQPGLVQFIPAGYIPMPMVRSLPATNELGCAWSLGALPGSLQGSNRLGAVRFMVPTNAQPGQHYTLHLLRAGGATDLNTELSMESASGEAWVASAPSAPPRHIVSDEWKISFFGSVTNADADPEADPDHDGVPNWKEYLAGTNPTNADSHLSFAGAARQPSAPGVALRWNAMSGRVYVVESSPSLVGGSWTAVSTNILGDGTEHSFVETNAAGGPRFYRIHLLEQ